MSENATIILWRPRGDEHQLAASLGMCEKDPDALRQLIDGAAAQIEIDHPQSTVRVHRWHVWRVVRAMQRCGVLNTPDGRAQAFAMLENENES